MSTLGEVVMIATLAGAATGIGALPVYVTERISHRFYDAALGLAAGIMFGAAVFALVVPGLEFGSLWEVVAGVLLGSVFLLAANRLIPHVHLLIRGEADGTYPPISGSEEEVEATPDFVSGSRTPVDGDGRGKGDASNPREDDASNPREGDASDPGEDDASDTDEDDTADADGAPDPGEDLRQAVLVGSAITIHNVPEGLAIGIAFAGGLEGVGLALAVAIAVQNVPDGFAMAIPASRTGLSKPKTILYTTLSGAVPEPIAAALGFALVAVVTGLFPLAAGFAAGTMLAVIFREMIPASHGHGYADEATLTFVLGFVVMVVVDVGLAV